MALSKKLAPSKVNNEGYWMKGGMKNLTPKDKLDVMEGKIKKVINPKRNLKPSAPPTPGSRYV